MMRLLKHTQFSDHCLDLIHRHHFNVRLVMLFWLAFLQTRAGASAVLTQAALEMAQKLWDFHYLHLSLKCYFLSSPPIAIPASFCLMPSFPSTESFAASLSMTFLIFSTVLSTSSK